MRKQFYNHSDFLGILEGKQKKAKAEAAEKIEAAKQQTLLIETLASQNGYNPQAEANQAAIDLTKAKSSSDIYLYVILAVIVVIVMTAIYFIRRK